MGQQQNNECGMQRQDGSQCSGAVASGKRYSIDQVGVQKLIDRDTAKLPRRGIWCVNGRAVLKLLNFKCFCDISITRSGRPDPAGLAQGTLEVFGLKAREGFKARYIHDRQAAMPQDDQAHFAHSLKRAVQMDQR